ncbi:hypothetical protein [Rothia aerolata]|uniref:MFS transporter n=1 Tax=Rothia aerolata TaxID=1812262 RepID=A0A917INX2_9MICC|nr:hypothetical protein [Rothia aerolata]GGH59023.1 hypothetical protein GCM10007359_05800 [Rothia aerolata]
MTQHRTEQTKPARKNERRSNPWLTRRRYALRYGRSRLNYLISMVGIEFFLYSFLMRLPNWMISLATLVIMTTRTGEVSLGTYGAGIIALASAMSHRTYRRLSLIFSKRVVIFISATLNIPAVAFLLVQMLSFGPNRVGGDIMTFLIAAALAGVTTSPLGAVMRSSWGQRYLENHDRRMLNAATAFESLLDLVALPLAAFLVGIIAIFGDLNAPLYAVIIIDLLGILYVLFRHNTIQPVGTLIRDLYIAQSHNHGTHRLAWIPMLGIACLGVCLGSTQTMLALRSISQDSVLNVGFYLAAMGSAGTVTCIMMNLSRARVSTWQGWLVLGVLLTLSSLLLSVPGDSFWLLVTLAIYGAVIGGGLMAIESIITMLTAHTNIDLAQSTAQATYIAGLALGYVWGGVFGSRFGFQSALLVPVIASAAYFIFAHLFGYRWRILYEERLKPLPEELTLKG